MSKTSVQIETDAYPALTPNTKIKLSLEKLWAIGVGVVAAAVWATVVYLDVQTLKKSDADKADKIDAINQRLSTVQDDVRQIRWILSPPVSKPQLVDPVVGKNMSRNP